MPNQSPAAGHRLGRSQRLKSRKRIQLLFREGHAHTSGSVRMIARFHDGEPKALQAGFTVGSRHFKKAVHRNRIKRLLREAWRLQKAPVEETLSKGRRSLDVFLIYTGRELPRHGEVTERVLQLVRRLEKKMSDGE